MQIQLKQAGFSLFELILVIVLLGIMASGAGLLITSPIDAYIDQVRRQLLVDQAEMALRQIARDVRRALPNSIRTTSVGAGWALEMVNTSDGARYRDEIGGVYLADTDILNFTSTDDQFNFLGLLDLADLTGQRLVIYNTAPANIYSDAASGASLGIITPAATTLTLTAPPPGIENHIAMSTPFQFSQQSPGQRAFFVDGPISYICDPAIGRITRYSNYAYTAAQPAPPAGAAQGPVVTQLAGCSINYTAGTAQRGGIITLEISLSDSGESITLLHQVHVDNVP
ncbi:MAG: type II secretion system protein [Gammaproteobacteria bacterium]|nr:type II secretion system protein [Gammaproteobacteria bacterium]